MSVFTGSFSLKEEKGKQQQSTGLTLTLLPKVQGGWVIKRNCCCARSTGTEKMAEGKLGSVAGKDWQQGEMVVLGVPKSFNPAPKLWDWPRLKP
jgi:hypothetical protein